MASVKNKLLVLSGKGGVGKSTFATQLAFALAAQGKEVRACMCYVQCNCSMLTHVKYSSRCRQNCATRLMAVEIRSLMQQLGSSCVKRWQPPSRGTPFSMHAGKSSSISVTPCID
jgi:MinD superfamily P-loop ATPase